VPWQPEDWEEWPAIDRSAGYGDATQIRAVLDILNRLPDLENKLLVELSNGDGSSLHPMARRCEPALIVNLAASTIESRVSPSTCDVIVGVDAIESDARASHVFAQAHGALVEGGVFLATLPARPRSPLAFSMPMRDPGAGFHEVELQFRLTCAGFQGLRLRRLRGSSHEPDRLLCMAVRRALN